jgi:uncharacterized protein (TIGR03905 family)
MDHFNFQTSPMVCSSDIDVEVDNGIIRKIEFTGGCHGNLQGVAKLAENRPVEEVISLLKGIRCNGKPTSCPDQLATALQKYLEKR